MCIFDTQPSRMSPVDKNDSMSIWPGLKPNGSHTPSSLTAFSRHKFNEAPWLDTMSRKSAGGILLNGSEKAGQPENFSRYTCCLPDRKERRLRASIVEPDKAAQALRQSKSTNDPRSDISPSYQGTPFRKSTRSLLPSPAPQSVSVSDESDDDDGKASDCSHDEEENDQDDPVRSEDDDDSEYDLSTSISQTHDDENTENLTIEDSGSLYRSPSPCTTVRLHVTRQDTMSGILDKSRPEEKCSISHQRPQGVSRRSLVFVNTSQEELRPSSSRRQVEDSSRRLSQSPCVPICRSSGAVRPRDPCSSRSYGEVESNPLSDRPAECPYKMTKWRSRSMDASTHYPNVNDTLEQDHGPCSVWVSQHMDFGEPPCPMTPRQVRARSAPLSGTTTRPNARSPKVGSACPPISKSRRDKAEELALVAERLLLHAHSDDSMDDDSSHQRTSIETASDSSDCEDDKSAEYLPSSCSLSFHRDTATSMSWRAVEQGPRRLSVPASLVPVPIAGPRSRSTDQIWSGPTSRSPSSTSTSPRLHVGTHGISLAATPALASSSTSVITLT